MNRIRELRESRGIPQKVLAIDLGVTQATVSNWESEAKAPSNSRARKIATYFGVTVDYLLGYDTEKPLQSTVAPDWLAALEITDSEKTLIRLYRQLNAEGQEKLLDNADDLVQTGKYKKYRVSGLAAQDTAVG